MSNADTPSSRPQDWPLLIATGLALGGSLFLGGATRGGYLSDALLQLMALPCLLIILARLPVSATRPGFGFLLFAACLVLVPLLQLVPLPPEVWRSLPGSEDRVQALATARAAPDQWLPLSMAPHLTAFSLASIAAPIAVFLGVAQLQPDQRRLLAHGVILFGLISALLGFLQVAQGPTSPLRFFEITNVEDGVGFFASRNQLGALLYTVAAFVSANLLLSLYQLGRRRTQKDGGLPRYIQAIVWAALLAVLVAGVMVSRSRMSLMLAISLMLGTLAAMVLVLRRKSGQGASLRMGVIGLALVTLFSLEFGVNRVLERFAADPLRDSRWGIARTTFETALSYLPFGSGLGTFVPVYAQAEDLANQMSNTYVNHAHNDYVQTLLEAGVLGLVLMVVFALWLIVAGMRALFRDRHLDATQRSLRLGALAGISLLLIHASVDYTLRTGAGMALAAFCCAILAARRAPA